MRNPSAFGAAVLGLLAMAALLGIGGAQQPPKQPRPPEASMLQLPPWPSPAC